MLINEFLPDPVGSDLGYEWIEVVNDDVVAVDLSGFAIQRATGAGYSTRYVFPAGTIVDPGERLVVGEEFVTGADLSLAAGTYLSLGNATLDSDGVRLCDSTAAVMDIVVYGANNANNLVDDTGGVAVPAAMPLEDETLARMPDGVDTDDSSVDFVVDPTPTPGADNATPPPMSITSGSPGVAGQVNTWSLSDGPPSCSIFFMRSLATGAATVPNGPCTGTVTGLAGTGILGSTTSDAAGAATLNAFVPASASGRTLRVQALAVCTCALSDVSETAFP